MSLLAGVAALLVVSLLAYGLARLYGAAVHGSKSSLTRLRRAFYVGLVVVSPLGLLAFLGAGGLDAIRSGPVGDLLGLLTMAGAVAVADTAYYLGLWPAIRSARDIDAHTTWAGVRFGRWLVAVLGPFTFAVYVLTHAPIDGVGGPLVFGAAVLLAVYAGGGVLVRLAQTTREPTDAERERIEAACEHAGFDPRSVRVMETGETRWAGVLVRGLPAARSLFVGSYLLSAYDDDTLDVQVARAAGQSRRGYSETKIGALVALVAAGTALLGAPGALGVGAAGGFAVVSLGLCWYGNRVLYAADADAADVTDAGTVVETYRRVAADADRALDAGGRLRNFLRMRPALRRRIGRLEERAD